MALKNVGFARNIVVGTAAVVRQSAAHIQNLHELHVPRVVPLRNRTVLHRRQAVLDTHLYVRTHGARRLEWVGAGRHGRGGGRE